MGLSLAWYDLHPVAGWLFREFNWTAAALCLLFAFVMQIAANFVNDYYDFKRGTDDEQRLGPKRACAQGWITEKAMRRGIVFTLVLACLIGLPLVCWGGWWLIGVGLLCVVFCVLYTTHFSYWGLGDLLVLVFFGIVPVCMTYYIQTGTVTMDVFCSSLACGAVIDTLLMVNNYRDRGNDRRTGKQTLVVRLGQRRAEMLYALLGVVPCLMGLFYLRDGRWLAALLPFAYLPVHLCTYRRMCRINHGRALNQILGETARNIFLYGALFSLGVVLDWMLFL